MFLAGLEPATFRVLGGRDNHYTTETSDNQYSKIIELNSVNILTQLPWYVVDSTCFLLKKQNTHKKNQNIQ